jgi:hypothetical protein
MNSDEFYNELKNAPKYSGGNTIPLSTDLQRKKNFEDNFWSEIESSKFGESKAWCLTIFTKNDDPPIKLFDNLQVQYLIYGSEICPKSKKHHWQSYIYFQNKKRFGYVRKFIFKKIDVYPHISYSKGSIEQNIAYCSKDEKYTIHGEQPKGQGHRTDIKDIADLIKDGKTNCEEILNNNIVLYQQYGRSLEKLEFNILKRIQRTNFTKGIWLFGKTGTGKTISAEHIIKTQYKSHFTLSYGDYAREWWDGYKHEEVLFINEFRGQVKYNDLLNFVDGSDFKCCWRGLGPIHFNSKCVIITSPYRPEEIYKNQDSVDSLEQLLRRFTIIEVKEGKDEYNIIHNTIHEAKIINKDFDKSKINITNIKNIEIPYLKQIENSLEENIKEK